MAGEGRQKVTPARVAKFQKTFPSARFAIAGTAGGGFSKVMRKIPRLHLGCCLAALALAGLPAPAAENQLTAEETRAGWKLLFDGQSLAAWRGYALEGLPATGWTIEGDAIKHAKTNGRPNGAGGDLVTREVFGDFDFRWEWRIGVAGNSGIKYFVIDRRATGGATLYVGDDGHSAAGFEYQMLDDERHPDAKNGPIRQSGSLYSLLPANEAKRLKPVGEFNRSRLVVRGNHVEHWLNDVKVVEYDLGSPEMNAALAKSKYKDVPGLGTKFKTMLLIQDHGEEVWLRNLKILPLADGTR